MATATASPSFLHSVFQSSRTLALGLYWGGAMVILFALWLGRSQPELDPAFRAIFWVLGGLGLVVAIWQTFTLRQSSRAPDQGLEILARQRRLIAFFLLGIGFLLLVLAGYLGYRLRLAGFGEAAGLGLFSLIPILAGFYYLQPYQETASSGEFLQRLTQQVGLLQPFFLVLAVVCISLFGWLGFYRKIGLDWFGELTALLLQSLLCLTCFFWLTMTKVEDRSPFMVRVLLLVFGGLSGLNLAVMALLRAFFWRKEVLFGGISTWQGEEGWKFWLCAYLEVVGLVLMFGSLLLARADVRSQPVLRQVLYGYNSVVTGILVLALLAVFNVVIYAMFPLTLEWSNRGLTSLSQSSKSLLGSLKEPTSIYVLIPENHIIFKDLKALMDNFQTQTNKLQVKYLSPDRNRQEFKSLAERFPEIIPSVLNPNAGRGLLVVYGALSQDEDKDKKVPHVFIPQNKLWEGKGGGRGGEKVTLIFNGEVELAKELSFLAQGQKKRKIYFLQGNGELDINNRDPFSRKDFREELSRIGMAEIVERLKKDNYDVQGFSFEPKVKGVKEDNIVFVQESGENKRREVPEDAWAVIVAGPSQEMPRETQAALERYMDREGRMVVALDLVLDPLKSDLKKTGLNDFLKKYGVLVGNDYVMRLADDDPLTILAFFPEGSTNELANQFKRRVMLIDSARVVRPDSQSVKFKADILLQAMATNRQEPIWEESLPQGLKDPFGLIRQGIQQGLLKEKVTLGPIPIAVTVSEGAKPRMVVFGDSELFSNAFLTQSPSARDYYSLFTSSLSWMGERGEGFSAGLKPKESSSYALPPTVNESRLVILPGWFMVLGIFGLGTGIWLVRRK